MLKFLFLLVMYLNFMKTLSNGFVINNDTYNQWLQPFNVVGASFKQWLVNNANQNEEETPTMPMRFDTPHTSTRNEHFESNPNSSKDTNNHENKSSTNDTGLAEPMNRVLETLQTQIDQSDNEGKKYYTELLMDFEKKLAQKSRYARVFFNHMWHVVDLGLYGSSQRKRNASAVDSALKPLIDLLNWMYRNIVDLLTWNLAPHDDHLRHHPDRHRSNDNNDDDSDSDDEEEKGKSGDAKEGIKVSTKVGDKGENHHKITHRFEIDPFTVNFNMDVTCRILDDEKKPKSSHTSTSNHQGTHKIPQDGDEETHEDDDGYDSSSDGKVTSSKVPKPKPTSSDGGAKPDAGTPPPPPKPGPASLDKKPSSKSPSQEDKPTTPSGKTGASDSQSTSQGGDKKSKKFEGNPVNRDLLANPPPPGKPLSYSDRKRMKPPPPRNPADDDDDDFDDWPEPPRIETNPYFLPAKDRPAGADGRIETNPHFLPAKNQSEHKRIETNPHFLRGNNTSKN